MVWRKPSSVSSVDTSCTVKAYYCVTPYVSLWPLTSRSQVTVVKVIRYSQTSNRLYGRAYINDVTQMTNSHACVTVERHDRAQETKSENLLLDWPTLTTFDVAFSGVRKERAGDIACSAGRLDKRFWKFVPVLSKYASLCMCFKFYKGVRSETMGKPPSVTKFSIKSSLYFLTLNNV